MRRSLWISTVIRCVICVTGGLTMFMWAAGCSGGGSQQEGPTASAGQEEVTYTGDQTCLSCHRAVHDRYHRTGMGRSIARFDTARAPEQFTGDTVVYDESRDLYYEAFVADGDLYQREYRIDGGGNRTHALAFQVDYVIGSGKATRSYLMEHNGYLTEMPLTWYVDRAKWDLSPGYRQSNPRFSRPVNLECMTCHSSRPERTPFTQNHYRRISEAISCERCHGPGSAHAARWQEADSQHADSLARTSTDDTIVNPADLDRERRLDVCLQCHLPGVAVFKPGEDPTTFRPGRPLAAHRTIYYPEEQIAQPRTFGIDSHPIRLANSACFERSDMTCITCHGAHDSPVEKTRAEYNAVCRSCHGGGSDLSSPVVPADTAGAVCSRPDASAASGGMAGGDCVSCHMQQGGTSDIPHIVFTDHWIRRDPPPGRRPDEIQRMETRDRPFTLVRVRERLTDGETSAQDSIDISGGVAELEAAAAYFKLYETKHMHADYLPMVIERARAGFEKGARMVEARLALGRALAEIDSLSAAAQVLETAAERYDGNAWVHLWLGDVCLKQGRLQRALTALQRARRLQPALIEAHIKFASALQRNGQNARAIQVLEQVTRRDSVHHPQAWNNLGLLYLQDQDLDRAAPALRRAVTLDPDFVRARVNLGSAYIMQRSFDQAVQQFRGAIAADSTFAPAYGNLGLVYAQQGRRQAARAMFERVLELQPDDRRARAMLRRLDRLE